MEFCGIDPGKKGGIALIDEDRRATSIEMPFKGGLLDIKKIKSLIEISDIVFIEEPIAMPKQSIKTARSSFTDYGKLLAIIEICGVPYQEIKPSIWKKEYHLIKKDKKASVDLASQMFPNIIFFTERGRMMDGKAEALLLADYALRKYNKK
ncbi:MAG: hypothetical protein ACFFG0_02315 [Candidatus Thorarchaeota archaeon]